MNLIKPANPTYALCVSYIVDNKVTRYLLWDAVGTNFSSTIPTYQGQVIGKNFRFEIWNSGQTNAIAGQELSFITSKLGGIDYRWGGDMTLSITDGQVTNFECPADAPVATAPTSGLLGHFDASSVPVGNVVQWVSTINVGDSLTWDGANAPICATYPDLNNKNAVSLATGLLSGGYVGAYQSMFGKTLTDRCYILVIGKVLNAANGSLQCFSLVDDSTNNIFSINLIDTTTRFYQLDSLPQAVKMTQALENWCGIAKIGQGFGGQAECALVSIPNNFIMNGVYSVTNDNIITTLTLAASQFAIAEIFVYSDAALIDYNALRVYLAQKYNSTVFDLPLVFPTNSTSVNN